MCDILPLYRFIHLWDMTVLYNSYIYKVKATRGLTCDMLIIRWESRNCFHSMWMKSFQHSRQLEGVNITLSNIFGKCHRDVMGLDVSCAFG